MKKKYSSYYNEYTGHYHSGRAGKCLNGAAEDQARVKHRYGGIKNLGQGALSLVYFAQAKSEESEYWKRVAQTLLPNLGI
ncbi:hypothetical protein ACOWOO_01770 [Helicobacter pylori]